MSDATAAECRKIYYAGRVQGVGFRFTVLSLVRPFAVTGYVRNLSDGRVELVAEGSPSEIRALLEAIADTMRFYIAEVQEEVVATTGQFDSFAIRY